MKPKSISSTELDSKINKLFSKKSKPITEKEMGECVFNLRGFAQTLIKMKMENDKNERIPR